MDEKWTDILIHNLQIADAERQSHADRPVVYDFYDGLELMDARITVVDLNKQWKTMAGIDC